jgi:hypothetical protein
MQSPLGPNLLGLSLRMRTVAAGDVVLIYAEPDLSDLDQLLKEQQYKDLLIEFLWITNKENLRKRKVDIFSYQINKIIVNDVWTIFSFYFCTT